MNALLWGLTTKTQRHEKDRGCFFDFVSLCFEEEPLRHKRKSCNLKRLTCNLQPAYENRLFYFYRRLGRVGDVPASVDAGRARAGA